MKRSAEKTKQPDDSNKKVLKLYDGSLYFGDETNLSEYDLQKDGAKKVEDDYEVHTPITRNNPEVDFDRPEWEVNSNAEREDELHIKDDASAWEKGVPDELASKNADNDCDNEDNEDVNGFTHHTDSDEIESIKEEQPIWGIDSSLVNAPTCVFDVTVLPEQWLTNDLQGWLPEDKLPHKDKTDTDTQGGKAQSLVVIASSQESADVDIKDNTDKGQKTDGKPNMETQSENEKLESGVESNTEVTSDNDHCDEASKSFGNKHSLTMGSTDDSNRSSPPSESNATSDSEDASGPPSIADLNYDTDDLARTWGSRCPSPEPDDNLFGFALPTPADILDNFIQQNKEEVKSSDLPKDVKGDAIQDSVESESNKETLDKEDCDINEAKIVENEKSSSKDLEIKDNSQEQINDLIINSEKNDSAKVDNHHSISEKENVESEPSVLEMKCHEKEWNYSPGTSRDHSSEVKESLKIFTPRKKIDSCSSLSRDSSPCRQKQPRTHQNTNDANNTDINKNMDTLSKGNTSPKPTRRKKRRQPAVKRKPEIVEKKVEVVVVEKNPELVETKSEVARASPTIPSMTLKDMTRLPLSDIIAIGKSMEPLKGSYSNNHLQNKPVVVAQSVREKQSPALKLVLPKEQKSDKTLKNVSPERKDEYSNWDSQEWNPFEDAEQKEMAFVTSHHKIAQDLTTKFNIPSSVDGQSDTDSGHWTAAHEERSSLRSSPRTTLCTPTDRRSVQSEEVGDTKTNDPASVTDSFSSTSHAQSARVSTSTTVDSNSQQMPNQFANAMPPTTSMPNMQQTPWFNMAMQCWAQQCMAAQQMQLMASQVQPSNSINPWMMPNQTNGNPMASFPGQSGMMNQVPPEMLAQMSGTMPNQMQSGMINPLQQGMSSHMPSTETINQMQPGMGFTNQRPPGISTMPGTYYGPYQQNSTNITSISSGMAPSAMIANPGTSITVTRPGENAQSSYMYNPNPMPTNHEQVRIAKAPTLSSNLVSTSTQPTGVESKKQHKDNTETQNVRVKSAKRCDVIKVSSLLKEEEDDIAEETEKEDETVVDDDEEDDDETDVCYYERIEGDKNEEEEESDEDESFHETIEDTRTRVSKNNTNTKRAGSAKKRSSSKGVRKYFASNSVKLMLVFQTLFILVVSIILYKVLDVQKF